MKKTLRKIIPAIAMLLISATLVGTSTFAWFSMNSKVTVTGMTVSTIVKDDLLIAPSAGGAESLVADSNFTTSYVANVTGILEPVSTVDGATFFYNDTKNTVKSGDARTNSYKSYDPADTSTFNTNYGTAGAVGYVDYAFQLKATNTSTTESKNVRISALNLVYGGSDTTHTAFRVAIFVDDMGVAGASDAVAPSSSTLLSILRKSGAQYFGATGTHTDDAVSATDAAPSSVNEKIDDAATIGSVAAGTTHYFRVVVRLWLEGEDTTCNNTTFATLTDKWALDLTVEMDTSAGITNIATAATASKLELVLGTNNGLTTDGNVLTINGVSYYKIADKTISTKPVYVMTSSTLATTSRIFTIADDIYPTEVTQQCDIVVAAAKSTVTGTVTLDGSGNLSNGVAPTGYQWYNASTGAAIDSATTDTYTNTGAAISVYCKVTTASGTFKTQTLALDSAV